MGFGSTILVVAFATIGLLALLDLDDVRTRAKAKQRAGMRRQPER